MTFILSSAGVQAAQSYDEQFLQLFTLGMNQLKQVSKEKTFFLLYYFIWCAHSTCMMALFALIKIL